MIDCLSNVVDALCETMSVAQASTILAVTPREHILTRIQELDEHTTDGKLTDIEQAEYECFTDVSNLIDKLQAKARILIGTSPD